ncbi:hypothetical protein [Dyella subtropica]|uniref:hypothetical protein n=1 Tax=Dyella subtropica TaxID=2992127 RepID=UPI0022547D51|nr:hypothetical protein [Dyella subtropica]
MSDPNNRPPIARTHYFSGESLLTADFQCEQQYNMEMLALLNSSLCTWGIASGLEVTWQPGSNQVGVSAGMAIDQLGRQIVLTTSQVLKFEGVPANSKIYLTIRYHEVFADYSVESGVAGYKRIVQQPVLEYALSLQDPGINILLAVVDYSSQSSIDALTYRSGQYERRYVGSRLGVVELVTEHGIHTQPSADGQADAPWTGVQLKALKESSGQGDYLEVLATRSHFGGMLTTRGNAGVGVDQPQANLQVERIINKGTGTLVTRGRLLRFQPAIYPPLQSGDIVVPELPVGAAPLLPRQAVIDIATGIGEYQMKQAFQQDLLLPSRYNYVRSTLVRFSAGTPVGDLLSIEVDGTVGLGKQSAVQSGVPGPAALSITADRRVGIALNSPATSQAALQVNGDVLASGKVTAQSFEGNGSGLSDLPILSYWTKQDVASTYSSIYYNSGNVGVQVSDPRASLCVGTGPGFIGSGSVTADKDEKTQLNGNQTAFKAQVSPGDSIVLGSLQQQAQQIKTITSDTQLELQKQFAVILQLSAYKSSSDAAGAGAKSGTGTVSSSGTTITGVGTKFTQDLKQGDWLLIEAFKPTTPLGYQSQWLVTEVKDDHTLIVTNSASDKPIPANGSAYMVSRTLMGMFQANADTSAMNSATTGAPPATPPPPAMLLISNGPYAKTNGFADNTVGINYELGKLDPRYALQVNGDVNFNGSSTFDKLAANQLTVKQWASITGPGNEGTVLAAGPNAATPLLSVTQNNVVVGTGTGGKSSLEVSGDVKATGNLIAGAQLQGASANVTGSLTGGALFASSMLVTGVGVDKNGNVTLFGNRAPIPISTSNNNPSGQAVTDGYIVASIGTVDPNFKSDFAGMLTCQTRSSTGVTSTNYASASTMPVAVKDGKKGSQTFFLPIFGTLCVPVRKGELWSLLFAVETQWKPAPNVSAYWVPLGPLNGGTNNALDKSPIAPAALKAEGATAPSADALSQSIETLRQRLASGGLQQSFRADAQQAIDQRAGDLARVLGDAVKVPADPAAREDFGQSVQKFVCAADPALAELNRSAEPQHIDDFIESLQRTTGHPFTAQNKTVLANDLRALLAIAYDVANVNDQKRVSDAYTQFLQDLQKAAGVSFDSRQQRLLTHALMRVVGGGAALENDDAT